LTVQEIGLIDRDVICRIFIKAQ